MGVDRSEMLRYLGHRDQTIDPELAARIEDAAARVEATLEPRGAFAVFAADVVQEGTPAIVLRGTALTFTGRDIFRHLKDARWVAVLVCTLGMASERLLMSVGTHGPLEEMLTDAALSAYVEAGVEAMDRHVRDLAAAEGLACNSRFSPGYGDLPLDVQGTLLATLNATRLLGVTASPAGTLTPRKSVTAVMGLFADVPAAEAPLGCDVCRVRDACSWRAHGTTCHRPSHLP